MSAHTIRIFAESKKCNSTNDTNTEESPFWWRGNDLRIELALSDAGEVLTSTNIGVISVLVKAKGAGANDAPLMLKTIGSADCDSSFTAADWQRGTKQLCVAEWSRAEAALAAGSYVLIVSHDALDGKRNTFLTTPIEVKEDQHDSVSLSAPPAPATEYHTKPEALSLFATKVQAEADYAKKVDHDALKVDHEKVREDHTLYVLAVGQSNMERGGDQYGTASWDNHPDNRVEILNTTTNKFEAWDLGTGTQNNAISSQSPAATAQASTIPYHFAKHIARVTGLRVRIIASAKSGQPISYWGAKTDGSAHDPTATGWQTLLSQLTHAPKIDCILWHQGESNGGNSKAEYLTAFQQMTQTLYGLTKVRRDAPLIAGDYISSAYGVSARAALAELDTQKATYPYFSFVRQHFAADSVTGQAIHYSDNSIAEFGKNYAQEYLRGVDSVKTPLTNRLTPDKQRLVIGRQAHINATVPKSIRISLTLPANHATDFVLDLAQTTHQSGANAVRGVSAKIMIQKYNTNWNVSSHGSKFVHNGIKTSIENSTNTSADIVIKFAHVDTATRTIKTVLSYDLLQTHANIFRNMTEDILAGIVSLNYADFDETDPLYLYGGAGTTDF